MRVALVFGGRSVEHEVSLVSARGVAAALDRSRYEIVPVAVTGEGSWLSPARSAEILASDAARVDAEPGPSPERVVPGPGGDGLLEAGADGRMRPLDVDVVFSVVHGWGGEDGRLQGLLDWAGLPCVGAGVLGSAAAMDKAVAKTLAEAAGIPVGRWRLLTEDAFVEDPQGAGTRLAEDLGLPFFVKPAGGGSSVGITKVREAGAVPGALREAFRFDRRVVVESGLDVRELECAVLGNERPEASVVGEIEPSAEFYDYAAKYLDGASKLSIPAAIDAAAAEEVRGLAVRVFRALDLAGMARVDFFLERSSGRVLFNEANTLPGFTPISMYPKLWEATGVSYPALLDRLIALAVERFRNERVRATRRDA
jgi:D-alanine-D-alanine ligase